MTDEINDKIFLFRDEDGVAHYENAKDHKHKFTCRTCGAELSDIKYIKFVNRTKSNMSDEFTVDIIRHKVYKICQQDEE